jgi:hypothetical protein
LGPRPTPGRRPAPPDRGAQPPAAIGAPFPGVGGIRQGKTEPRVGPASRPRSSPTRSPPSAHPRGLGPRARPGPAPLWPPGRPEARDTDARIPYRFTTPVLILICLTRGSAMVPGARRRRGESRGTVRGGGRQRRLSARSCRPRACAASRPRPSPGTRAGRLGSPAGAAGCLLLSRRPGFFHTHTEPTLLVLA